MCDSAKLVIAYDGSGRRISKTRMNRKVGNYWRPELRTHYTGVGTEVRESFTSYGGEVMETKAVVNMPNGLGRYGVEDAEKLPGTSPLDFEWYLKNHLGSTMLVYGTQGSTDMNKDNVGEAKAKYYYRSFGEQVSLMAPAEKVTENFTGKELDDETSLDYFGARYLDPMLGLWISVDPKRQYQNPYLYAGNNPVMRIDPDGNEDANSFGWNMFVRDMHVNEIAVLEKLPGALADAGVDAAAIMWRAAKGGTVIAALCDFEPGTKAALIGINGTMNLAEAAFKNDGVGAAKAGIGVGASYATRNAKAPTSIGVNFAVDASGLILDRLKEGIQEKMNAEPTKMLPTSGPAPADNTNIAFPIKEE